MYIEKINWERYIQVINTDINVVELQMTFLKILIFQFLYHISQDYLNILTINQTPNKTNQSISFIWSLFCFPQLLLSSLVVIPNCDLSHPSTHLCIHPSLFHPYLSTTK